MLETKYSRRLDSNGRLVIPIRLREEMGLEVCGTHGTTAALAMLNDAVKKGGVMASSYVGGLSGAFIPVSEDAGMIAAKLGAKYGYAFNCQSNFCEPQFIRLWRDVEYHKELTDIIKNTKL